MADVRGWKMEREDPQYKHASANCGPRATHLDEERKVNQAPRRRESKKKRTMHKA
jgi:hypothetical protein